MRKENTETEPLETTINRVQSNGVQLGKDLNHANPLHLFAETGRIYINGHTFFVSYFHAIPNSVQEIKIDCKRAIAWFAAAYHSQIKDLYFNKRYFDNSKQAEYDDVLFVLFDDLVVHFDTNCAKVEFLFKTTPFAQVQTVMNEIKNFKARKQARKPMMSLLINTAHGIDTKLLHIKKPKLDMDYNYNDDFKPIHQTIIKRLSKKDDKGLVLLHGKPGTGKTSYIRYLIASLKKNVIFLPPNMANAITNPDLISVLINNSNSIFVIEDAENIVMDREKDGQSRVSALLNISDGLLSDCLNIQIICSFNTDISKVDSALLRKGRLIAKYEFKELEIDKAQALSQKLGFISKFNTPMTLTAIYNQEEKDFQQRDARTAIGFKIA